MDINKKIELIKSIQNILEDINEQHNPKLSIIQKSIQHREELKLFILLGHENCANEKTSTE